MAVIGFDLEEIMEQLREEIGDPRFPPGYEPDALGQALLEAYALVITRDHRQ